MFEIESRTVDCDRHGEVSLLLRVRVRSGSTEHLSVKERHEEVLRNLPFGFDRFGDGDLDLVFLVGEGSTVIDRLSGSEVGLADDEFFSFGHRIEW